ncbi:MAG: hypothetical protein ABSE93_15700 [Terriglobia bacterium]
MNILRHPDPDAPDAIMRRWRRAQSNGRPRVRTAIYELAIESFNPGA